MTCVLVPMGVLLGCGPGRPGLKALEKEKPLEPRGPEGSDGKALTASAGQSASSRRTRGSRDERFAAETETDDVGAKEVMAVERKEGIQGLRTPRAGES